MESPLENCVQVISKNSVFEIPYNKIPKSAISKLERGERPTPAERRQIVRIVVAELLETVPTPRQSQLEPIAKEIVGKYPRSFSDYIGDSVIGGGHSSLLCQLIARVENCRRVSSTQLKQSLSTESTGQKGPEKVCATAKYGCTEYQPNFPEGESPETVKRTTLVEDWKMETRNASVVDSLMDNTYPLLRLDVNKQLPLALIKENWSFLCFFLLGI
ncbi:hypothetical protein AVEN_87595-1 [Araneus ventricosus]|uniref:Uncharacterized protein n=1 Tax=Araneus ventricosus TaxID=182803 RepID=A0A4Y2LUK5_ARAVE|nr:hypothetical protein AVEN_87595-1 [Araneus ventricosus]